MLVSTNYDVYMVSKLYNTTRNKNQVVHDNGPTQYFADCRVEKDLIRGISGKVK